MRVALLLALLTASVLRPASADPLLALAGPWPEPPADIAGADIAFASTSPYVLTSVGRDAPPATARGTLFLPRENATRAPAVVLLHGASGVQASRELTYGRQFAAMGMAALVVDVFAARRELATDFTGRLLNITETMFLADAYAALALLAARPDIDPGRIAVMGFSYGAMVSVFAAYLQVADLMAPGGPRFAAHVAYYGPCMARFEDRRTTGAPVLMLAGDEDTIMDQARCAAIADDLRTGGSAVQSVVYPGAAHQWDGGFNGRRVIGRSLAACDYRVQKDGAIRDRRTTLPMIDGLTRRITLLFCVGDPYPIARDDTVRALSNRDTGAFLARSFGR